MVEVEACANGSAHADDATTKLTSRQAIRRGGGQCFWPYEANMLIGFGWVRIEITYGIGVGECALSRR